MATSRIAMATVGAAALIALAGCTPLTQSRLDFSNTEEVKITQITVARGGSGDVVVITGQVSNVQIDRVVRYHGGEPRTTGNYRINGTELLLDADCGQRCSVSYEIIAPEGVSVRGETGSGEVSLTRVGTVDIKVGSGGITVNGASGTVKAETGSGEVSISDVKSAVTARTGSGGITGRGLGDGQVDVETGSGSVSLTLSTAGSVRAHTASGEVELAVPPGSYRVSVNTGTGDKNVGVSNDPTATLHLDVKTGSGDVTISQR
ncbi:DUF4097 family beta strand repeat-containing protein [Micromonospora sonneratiae]|uniref:DUF4097 family beta strand repeat-containing protein n=1 Tax=Micromonospora sonneratiae TaxID=1184706 RepID=A0ABW3YFC3_9ACTN